MNYFKILGITFGMMALLKPVYMHLIPWNEMKAIKETYTSKKPKWIVPTGIIGLLLVGLTWYIELTTSVKYSIFITVLFSLTVIKALFFIFDYAKFQKWVAGMLEKDKGKRIILVDIGAGIFGLVLVSVSLYIF